MLHGRGEIRWDGRSVCILGRSAELEVTFWSPEDPDGEIGRTPASLRSETKPYFTMKHRGSEMRVLCTLEPRERGTKRGKKLRMERINERNGIGVRGTSSRRMDLVFFSTFPGATVAAEGARSDGRAFYIRRTGTGIPTTYAMVDGTSLSFKRGLLSSDRKFSAAVHTQRRKTSGSIRLTETGTVRLHCPTSPLSAVLDGVKLSETDYEYSGRSRYLDLRLPAGAHTFQIDLSGR